MTSTARPDAETPETAHRITVRCQFCETWNRVVAERASDRPKCGKCGKPMLIDRPIALNDDTFTRTVTESEIPVLVDFYADWCGPCKIMAPSVDQLAAENQGKLLVAKLDTDRAPHTAQSYNIPLFDGSVERVHIDVYKFAHRRLATVKLVAEPSVSR